MLKNLSSRTRKILALIAASVVILAVVVVIFGQSILFRSLNRQLMDGRLVDADYWRPTAQILSAGLGFNGIIGVPALDEKSVREAGGAWDSALTCANGQTPAANQRTSAALADGIEGTYRMAPGAVIDHDDGLPIVFSWPVRTDTLDPLAFKFTLNTGRVVYPKAAGMIPNFELNERNVVVVFGHFSNRGKPGEPNAEFPVKLEIVATAQPLILVGPTGEQSAVGLSWTTDKNPYAVGPTLVGAKLNRVDNPPTGEGGVAVLERQTAPNDEIALYGTAAKFRLRMLTTGGFSPDGVHGVRPDDFEKYFRVQAEGPDGKPVIMDKVGVDYQIAGGTLKILGMSDLGKKADQKAGVFYDNCYVEDRDNYIDIIFSGDEAAARHITALEIPSLEGGYHALYNPGGPGPMPFDGVRYTAPSPAHIEPVIMALDDPMRVSR